MRSALRFREELNGSTGPSQVALVLRNTPAKWWYKRWFDPWVGKILWRKA